MFKERKHRGFTWISMKSVILELLMVFQLLTFFHYAIAGDEIRIVFLILEMGVRGFIYYLVALFFLKRKAKLLKNKKRWASLMNKLLIVVLMIYIATACFSLYIVFADEITEQRLCNGYVDILMQSDCFLVIIVFIILGAFITKRISEQQTTAVTTPMEQIKRNH